MKEKKGLAAGVSLVLIFGIIATFFIFVVLFTQNFTHDVVSNVSTELQSVGTNLGFENSTVTAINDLETKHAGIDYKLDTFFLIAWVSVFTVSLAGAYYAPPLPTFNFFTMLLFGIMFLLFVSNFLVQIMDYLIENLITNVFSAAQTNLPTFNFYTENYYIIVVVWIALLLITNQMSKVISSFSQQLEEEVVE